MSKNKVPMLSVGLPSTLGNWLSLCETFFGKDSSPAKFIKDRIKEATNGENEVVLSDETQLLQVLGKMAANDIEETKIYNLEDYRKNKL